MDDFDYKDINDFDFSELDNFYDDYYEGLRDDEIINKEFTKEELEDFKHKVKSSIEDLIEQKVSESKDSLIEGNTTVDSVLQEVINELYDDDNLNEKILENFNGQRELFFKFAKEVVEERKEEIEEDIEEIQEQIKEEMLEKLNSELKARRGLDQREIVDFIKYNPYDYNIVIDADFITDYLIEEGGDDSRKFISTEALSLIPQKLIQEDDGLMSEILECYIAPSRYINGLDYDLGEVSYSDEYKVYEGSPYGDLSEYYEEFYNKVMSQNESAKNGRKFNLWADRMMPTRLLKSEGYKAENLHDHDYADSFILKTLIDMNDFNKIDEFIPDFNSFDESVEYDQDRLNWIRAFADLEHRLAYEERDKAAQLILNLIDGVIDEYYRESALDSDTDFILECYIRDNKEIPDDLKEKSIPERIERIKKEVELERLELEDMLCEEELELVEEIDKKQDGQILI